MIDDILKEALRIKAGLLPQRRNYDDIQKEEGAVLWRTHGSLLKEVIGDVIDEALTGVVKGEESEKCLVVIATCSNILKKLATFDDLYVEEYNKKTVDHINDKDVNLITTNR
jgi:hypothetical protein